MTELEKEINNLRSGLKNVENVSTDQWLPCVMLSTKNLHPHLFLDPIYLPINMFESFSLICLSCTGAGIPEKVSTGGGR